MSSGAVRGAEAHLAGGEEEAVPWQPEDTHLYNYSITFQPSYSVPILLFSGRKLGEITAELRECLDTLTLCRCCTYLSRWWTLSTYMSGLGKASSTMQQGHTPGLQQKQHPLRSPQLCCAADGAPLSWEDTLHDLPAASQATAKSGDARWSFITQQEHPATRAAMHSIHPCETATLMSLLLAQEQADAGPTAAR